MLHVCDNPSRKLHGHGDARLAPALTALSQAWDHPHLTASCWLAGNLLAAVGSGGEVYVFQVGTRGRRAWARPW